MHRDAVIPFRSLGRPAETPARAASERLLHEMETARVGPLLRRRPRLFLLAAILVRQRQIVLAAPMALLHLPVPEHVAVGGTDLAAAGDQHREVLRGEHFVGLGLMLAAIVRIRHGVPPHGPRRFSGLRRGPSRRTTPDARPRG